jgi:hypothetical protein
MTQLKKNNELTSISWQCWIKTKNLSHCTSVEKQKYKLFLHQVSVTDRRVFYTTQTQKFCKLNMQQHFVIKWQGEIIWNRKRTQNCARACNLSLSLSFFCSLSLALSLSFLLLSLSLSLSLSLYLSLFLGLEDTFLMYFISLFASICVSDFLPPSLYFGRWDIKRETNFDWKKMIEGILWTKYPTRQNIKKGVCE